MYSISKLLKPKMGMMMMIIDITSEIMYDIKVELIYKLIT